MSDLQLSNYAGDLTLSANRLVDIANEVAELVGKGDLDGAALVLGVSGGKLHEMNEGWSTMWEQLRAAGADPDRSVEPS